MYTDAIWQVEADPLSRNKVSHYSPHMNCSETTMSIEQSSCSKAYVDIVTKEEELMHVESYKKQNTGKPIKMSFLICIQVWKTKSFQFSRNLLKTEATKRVFHSSIFPGKRKICQHLTHPICFRKNENNQCIPEKTNAKNNKHDRPPKITICLSIFKRKQIAVKTFCRRIARVPH
ncbi:hypothetical protein LXL04_039379 [Taraxacum kok-saghyz]